MRTGTSRSTAESGQLGLRLGGARADFVAGLGRKLSEIKIGLGRVREHPDDIEKREDLRRKLHALGSGAKLMKFDAMERSIAEALGVIDRSAIDLPLDAVDIDTIDQILEDLPALAWGDGESRPSRVERIARSAVPRYSALVVGPAMIGEALLHPMTAGDDDRAAFTCESTPDAQAAFDIARVKEPDLVVLDADLEYATELVDALMDDPITESSPIVVVGSFLEQGEAARYVAMGVAKTLAKPTSREALRNACIESLEAVRVEACAPVPDDVRVGRTGEGISVAPSDPARSERHRGRARGPSVEVRLQGRRVIVADDDPAVVWFMADLLKNAGCVVHEAFDGKQALEMAYKTSPDLVISDILMPNLDGFSLCRALRRDVALRDVPVILLSWKEDLLQRVRELGAGAAGYVKKESDTRAIVARVREALRPRARIEMRVRDDDGEVRGRMDGMSVRTLLEIVCAMRPEARVSIRDASFNYEVEIRYGAPHRATRTSGDGTVLEGPQVLTAMMGIGAGRFTVSSSNASLQGNLEGNLAAQLARPIARARAALSLLVGAGAARVGRVRLDADSLDDYLRATPSLAGDVARRLSTGTPPRALSVDGAVDPSIVEDLLCDLSARGIVCAIEDANGVDIFGAEIARFKELTDARASFAPSPATPDPGPNAAILRIPPKPANDCVVETRAPLCESPSPSAAAEDSAAQLFRSPTPAQLGLPLAAPAPAPLATFAETDRAISEDPPITAMSEPASPVAPYEGTPPHDQILALGEATVVDDTVYGEEDANARNEESEPAIEISNLPPESDSRANKTPFTTVRTDDEKPAAKKRAWPMIAFVVATGAVAWAVMHFSFAGQETAKTTERAAPPAEPAAALVAPHDITYANVGPEANVPSGEGVLKVSAPGDSIVLVDGKEQGRGTVTVTLPVGAHEVKISGGAGESTRTVDVRVGKVAHLTF